LSQCNIDSDGKVNYLGQSELCQLICKSNAGLILSRKEGANFASGEYQFCGIPVITTKSRGGRHYFFDEISTFYVPPSAHVISWVVDRIASRYEWDSSAISARAVARAIEGRVRLLDFISNLAGRKVHAEANANAWLPSFRDKLRERIDL
jgi:glycosyltransferase involved in cell wall biosynthesis